MQKKNVNAILFFLANCLFIIYYLKYYKSVFNSKIENLIYENKIENFLIMTITKNAYREFTLNWILNLKKLNINKFLVFCYDKEVFDYFESKGYKENLIKLPKEWSNSKLVREIKVFESKEKFKILRAKFHILNELLKQNHNILFSDSDVVIHFLSF
jgi:hypothetical protein